MANYATSALKLNDTYVNTLPYNTCSTAAGTAAKTVSAGDFSLETGAMVVVKFTVANTAANPTLNVSSTGAKAINYNGAAITAGYLKANKIYQFIYNGTQWDLVGDVGFSKTSELENDAGFVNTDTTYTFAQGDNNGQIKVTPSSGSVYNVDVKGLGSAAFTPSTNYAPAYTSTTVDPGAGSSLTTGTLLIVYEE